MPCILPSCPEITVRPMEPIQNTQHSKTVIKPKTDHYISSKNTLQPLTLNDGNREPLVMGKTADDNQSGRSK